LPGSVGSGAGVADDEGVADAEGVADTEGTGVAVVEGVGGLEQPAMSSSIAAAAGYRVRMMTSTSMVVRTRMPVNEFARESGIDTATKW
jgi:hypothetical protein